MEVPWLNPPDCSVNWEGYGLDFLGCWYSYGCLSPKGADNHETYYASLLRQLRENIKVKRLGQLSGVLFYQDNAPAGTSVIA